MQGRKPALARLDVRDAGGGVSIVGRLIEGVRPVRALLQGLVRLPWRAHAEHSQARALGRSRWYGGFQLRVARVERAYGMAPQADRALTD